MSAINETRITIPQLGLIALTRALLGGGIGLLVADRLREDHRKAVGWTLVAVGAITTVPLAYEVLSQRRIGTGREEKNAELLARPAA